MLKKSSEKPSDRSARIKAWIKKEHFYAKLTAAFAILFTYLCIRCYDMRYTYPFLEFWWDEVDVVGVWRFDPYFSQKSFDPEEFKDFELTLNEDMTFRMSGIPLSLVAYTEDKVNDAPRTRIKEYHGLQKKIWILSSSPIDAQTVIEGKWSVVEIVDGDHKEQSVDLTASGYNFEPWRTAHVGLFSSGAPYDNSSKSRKKGVMLELDRPLFKHEQIRFHSESGSSSEQGVGIAP